MGNPSHLFSAPGVTTLLGTDFDWILFCLQCVSWASLLVHTCVQVWGMWEVLCRYVFIPGRLSGFWDSTVSHPDAGRRWNRKAEPGALNRTRSPCMKLQLSMAAMDGSLGFTACCCIRRLGTWEVAALPEEETNSLLSSHPCWCHPLLFLSFLSLSPGLSFS